MTASNNAIQMADMSTQSKLQTPIEVEESDPPHPLDPDAIIMDLQPEIQDDPDDPNKVDKEIEVIIKDGKNKQKWFRYDHL